MAIGDDAVAAGMSIMTGSELANTIDTEINRTRDEIARRTSTVMPVAKGGTGATTPADARANLGAASATHNHDGAYVQQGGSDVGILAIAHGSGRPQLFGGGSFRGFLAYTSDLDGVRAGYLSSDVYNRAIGGAYRVCYVAADGTLGWVSSSRRHKKNIRPAEVDPQAVLAMQLVTFLYKVEIDTAREGITQWGFIAEQAHELGLEWLVDYGEDGAPEGFRYDRFALALLPVVQHLAAQLDTDRAERNRLADRVAAIETHLDAIGGGIDAPTA